MNFKFTNFQNFINNTPKYLFVFICHTFLLKIALPDLFLMSEQASQVLAKYPYLCLLAAKTYANDLFSADPILVTNVRTS